MFTEASNRTERPNRTEWTEGRRDYLAIAGVVVTVLTLLRLVSLLSISPSTECVDASCEESLAACAAAQHLSYPCTQTCMKKLDKKFESKRVHLKFLAF